MAQFQLHLGQPILPEHRREPDGTIPVRDSTLLPNRNAHPQQAQNIGAQSKINAAQNRLLQVAHATFFGRLFSTLEIPDQKLQKFLDEFVTLLKIANIRHEIPENWQNQVMFAQDFLFSGSPFVNFTHEAIQNANFINISSLDEPELQETLRSNLKAQIDVIFSNPYIMHFLSQLEYLGEYSDAEQENFYNVDAPEIRRPSFWLQEKILKIQNLFLGFGFCARCCVKLESQEATLLHLNAKHKNCIRVEYAEEMSNLREKKLKELVAKKCKDIHDANHEGCIDCQFSEDEDL